MLKKKESVEEGLPEYSAEGIFKNPGFLGS